VLAETREFLQSVFTFTMERMQRFGPVVYTNGLLRSNVMLCGSEAMGYFYDEELVQRHGAFPPNFPWMIGGTILPMTDGRHHEQRRAIVEQAFMHPGALADYLRRLDATVSAYAMRWARQKDVDLLHQVHLMCGAVTGLIGFGSMGEGEELSAPMKHNIEGFVRLPIPVPGTPFMKAEMGKRRLYKLWRQKFELSLQKAQTRAPTFTALAMDTAFDRLALALLAQRQMGGHEVSNNDMVKEIEHLMLATYATYNPILNMLVAFAQYPDVQEKTRAEIKRVFTGSKGPIGLLQLSKQSLPYLHKVTMEARRFYPTMAGMFGQAKKDFTVHGCDIKQGWYVAGCFYATNHCELDWNEPETFNPDRFDTEPKGPIALSYVPQGGAPNHRCVGEYFTTLLMKLVAVHLLRGYAWDVPAQDLSYNTSMFVPTVRNLKVTNFRPAV